MSNHSLTQLTQLYQVVYTDSRKGLQVLQERLLPLSAEHEAERYRSLGIDAQCVRQGFAENMLPIRS